MANYDEMVAELKRLRDEAKLQIHLASADAKTEWEKLEVKWKEYQRDFDTKAAVASDKAEADFDKFTADLKDGYNKMLESLKA